jgi:hypothetical protein
MLVMPSIRSLRESDFVGRPSDSVSRFLGPTQLTPDCSACQQQNPAEHSNARWLGYDIQFEVAADATLAGEIKHQFLCKRMAAGLQKPGAIYRPSKI